MMKKIKVLIVDDSALVREILKKGLSMDPLIEVVGSAADAYEARDKIVLLKPDVLTLDIQMPKMDGIDFLRRLMPQYPMPVVVVSALAAPGARATLDALEYGAVDFVLKPSTRSGSPLSEMIDELKTKIKMASKVDLSKSRRETLEPDRLQDSHNFLADIKNKVIAIGASTGGTTALNRMICGFPPHMPGTGVVQHMPSVFTRLFADRLNEKAVVEVKEAETGDRVQKGKVLIAPGDKHLEVVRSGGSYLVKCRNGKKVNGHCPSVEVLFDSVTRNVGANAIGVMLTGMGRDGAKAMLTLKQAGARTFAQDEESSAVFGMPKAAYEIGGAERLVSLDEMNSTLIKSLKDM
jgi:two-component system chemotaxis response regulator CheB